MIFWKKHEILFWKCHLEDNFKRFRPAAPIHLTLTILSQSSFLRDAKTCHNTMGDRLLETLWDQRFYLWWTELFIENGCRFQSDGLVKCNSQPFFVRNVKNSFSLHILKMLPKVKWILTSCWTYRKFFSEWFHVK